MTSATQGRVVLIFSKKEKVFVHSKKTKGNDLNHRTNSMCSTSSKQKGFFSDLTPMFFETSGLWLVRDFFPAVWRKQN